MKFQERETKTQEFLSSISPTPSPWRKNIWFFFIRKFNGNWSFNFTFLQLKITQCIPRKDFQNSTSPVRIVLYPGNYSMRIRADSLFGPGKYSEEININIKVSIFKSPFFSFFKSNGLTILRWQRRKIWIAIFTSRFAYKGISTFCITVKPR